MHHMYKLRKHDWVIVGKAARKKNLHLSSWPPDNDNNDNDSVPNYCQSVCPKQTTDNNNDTANKKKKNNNNGNDIFFN